ncbi:photosystem reaction center subunit H [Bacillus coahuilensis m2-6]|uniref:PRC-barrel domain-containing protein n=1 Tax=Bacillus coahuilensis TaxID=408580 RepID=UPI000185082F|nr:PRC-barrel domain-containing protein [Bacillus coahuilensis]KUP06976.1 photosystem reaction center subunit H [Bacillus coahuilensis m2-6]
MKKSAEIKGLPIISIGDGSEIGKVKSLVVNPEKGSIDFLTIEHEVSVKAIPFKKVVGIGEFAVTVETESAVIDLNEIPIANQLVNKKIRINETRVMTRKGQLIGEITEYYVDEENGLILGMDLRSNQGDAYLEAKHVLTFGKDIIVVQEDAMNHYKKSATEAREDVMVEEVKEESAPSQLENIRKEQDSLLIGKKVTKDIYDPTGSVIIHKDIVLEEVHVEVARLAGPSVFVELSMNVE